MTVGENGFKYLIFMMIETYFEDSIEANFNNDT